MIQVDEITQLQHRMVACWHENDHLENPYDGFLELVCRQHEQNFRLWHEEDIARSPDAGDEEIAQVKRNIDQLNQQRNDFIEKLDATLIALMQQEGIVESAAPLNTETPGSAIDRLSIMSLRIYHMREQMHREDATEAHRDKAARRLSVCREQHADLSRSLEELLADLFTGRKRLKVYRQFKMYNDPTMNPYLYNTTHRKAG
jgi:hypothetical protein